MSKLNLGCGYNQKQGWINTDSDPECKPDLCFDLTKPNWPIETSTVDEVLAEHILEHLEGTEGYLTFWKELYRVCQHGATIKIEVPHWQHETFFHDPTHVRAITPVGVAMFDQQRNQGDLESNGRETKLGFMCKVDFEMQGVNYINENLNGQPIICQYLTKVIKPARYKP
jgi:hypothetical protein